MPRTSYKDQLKSARAELERSRRWRDQGNYDAKWRRMKNLYAGKHYEKADGSRDRVVVNIAFANINVVNPSVSINYPKFTVMPRNPDSAAQAIITEQVLNYEWRKNQWQDEFRAAVNDMLQLGHGWVKVSYKFVKEEVANADQPYEHTETVDEAVPQAETIQTDKVLEDRPIVERVSVFDLYVDPDARNPKELRWIAQRIWRPIEAVRKDKRYDTEARKNAKATRLSRYDDDKRDDGTPSETEEQGDRKGYCEIIEFYDIDRCTFSVFERVGGDSYLIKPQKIPFAFGHPFTMVRNSYEVVDEFYPMGEIEAIETLQQELNETRNQMLNFRKKYARKYIYDSQVLSDENAIARLESDEDNVLVPIQGGDIRSAIIPLDQIMTPPEFFDHSDMIVGDMQHVSGVSEYQRGALPEIRRTATEAAIIQDSINARASDKLARVESTLARIGERVVQLMQQYMTGEKVARVVRAQQFPVWINYDKHYIEGQFDFEVEAGSTQPNNETFRRQSAMQLVDAMAPFFEAGVINAKALADHVLTYGFGLKTTEGIVQEPPPPMPEELPPGEGGVPPEGGQEVPPEGAPPAGGPPPGEVPIQPDAVIPPGGMPPQGPPMGPGGPPMGGLTLSDGTPIPPELIQQAEAQGIPPEMLVQIIEAQLAEQGPMAPPQGY